MPLDAAADGADQGGRIVRAQFAQGLAQCGRGDQGHEGAGHAVARAVGDGGEPAARVALEKVEVAADHVARLPFQVGVGQRGGRAASEGAAARAGSRWRSRCCA
jgi:hypothetical protein